MSTAVQVGIQVETFQNTVPETLRLNRGVCFWNKFMEALFHKAIFVLGVYITAHLLREKENSGSCTAKETFTETCYKRRNIMVVLKA